MTPPAVTAFVSYSRTDSEFALRLAQDLKAADASIWLDQLDIPPGKPWDDAIEEALNNTTYILVILSPEAVRSKNVKDEIDFALRASKTIGSLHRVCQCPRLVPGTQLRPYLVPVPKAASPKSQSADHPAAACQPSHPHKETPPSPPSAHTPAARTTQSAYAEG